MFTKAYFWLQLFLMVESRLFAWLHDKVHEARMLGPSSIDVTSWDTLGKASTQELLDLTKQAGGVLL